jgi:hypothetical protein
MRRALALAVLPCVACTVGYPEMIRYLPQDGAQCSPERYARDSCVIEIPAVGYLNFMVRADVGPDETDVIIRLAPQPGVEVRWASPELLVADLDKGTSTALAILPTNALTGTSQEGPVTGYLVAFYGPYLEGRLHLRQRIPRAEVRFPDLVSSGKVIRGMRFRYTDGARPPVPVPAYHSH